MGLVRGKESCLVSESFSVNMARSVLMRKLRCRSAVTQHKLMLANGNDCTHTGSASSVSQDLTYYELTEIGQSFSEENCYLAAQFPHILFYLWKKKGGGLLKNQLQVLANIGMKVYGVNENSRKEDMSAETN